MFLVESLRLCLWVSRLGILTLKLGFVRNKTTGQRLDMGLEMYSARPPLRKPHGGFLVTLREALYSKDHY